MSASAASPPSCSTIRCPPLLSTRRPTIHARTDSFHLPTHAVPSPVPSPVSSRAPSPAPVVPKSSMLLVVVHHILDWFHLQASAPDIPAALPMSAADGPTPLHPSKPRFHLSSNHLPILTVILLFPLSTALVFLSLYTLPISLAWPRTITDLAQLGTELHGYSTSGPRATAHVVAVMSISAIWKHAWSIPGSVVWNVLAGALFSPVFAVFLLSILTMLGSACATLLSAPLAPFLSHSFPRALDMTRAALQGSEDADDDEKAAKASPAWVRLSILRLIGVVPWSGINIACGVSGVPLSSCMLGAFIGTLPWTAVTCQIGDILFTVASHPTSPASQTVSSLLASPAILVKLAVLSFLSLAPILARDRLKSLISTAAEHDDHHHTTAWLRAKFRHAPAAAAHHGHNTLADLVSEKRALESQDF